MQLMHGDKMIQNRNGDLRETVIECTAKFFIFRRDDPVILGGDFPGNREIEQFEILAD